MDSLALPALHASHAGTWLRSGGATRGCSKGEAIMAAADTPVLLLNAPLVASRLGYPDLSGLDLLELYAFVNPARFMVPTPKGLAHALGLDEPASDDGSERREGQRAYAREAGRVFAPRSREKRPHLLLAQAGTGIGKTLGYLAPASLRAEKSQGTVWVST